MTLEVAPTPRFEFNYLTFPIRARTFPLEFDSIVFRYARYYVAHDITRGNIYKNYCQRNGYIGSAFQERLTDPSHPLSLVKDLSPTLFARLCALTR
jgi:hypothetical protein